jgi:AcrR family transcriptional regulator
MRISKAQKEKNRRTLIFAAVDLFSEHGYENVTMKQVSKAAEMADSTVYKYFPNKDKFLFAYHELVLLQSMEQCREENAYDGFDLQEKVQFFLDLYLENLLNHREFVGDSLKMLMSAPLSGVHRSFPARDELLAMIGEAIDTAVDRNEIPELPYKGAIIHLMTDAILGVVMYWLKDDSEEFNQTTQMIDLSLSLMMSLFRSDILSKANDLAGFVFKSQMARFLEDGSLMSGLVKSRGLGAFARGQR